MGAPHVHVEQVTTQRTLGAPHTKVLLTTTNCVMEYSSSMLHYTICGLSLVKPSGGGPVSGGGTLYMKWGAGSLRYRECEMREQV